jgi:peptidase C39-like protein
MRGLGSAAPVAVAITLVVAFLGYAHGVAGVSPSWLRFALTSSAQPCLGGSDLVASLFGNDIATQIRLATPDLRTEHALRSEPAARLSTMFDSLLSVSADGKRIAYVTAGDEVLDDAQILYLNVARPDQVHLVASIAGGLLPIRPVWSSDASQIAYVVSRQKQGNSVYQVLAAPAAGGPAIDLATLPPATFDRIHSSSLCVTSTGAINLVPTPTPTVERAAAEIATPAPKSVPSPSPTTERSSGGATPCAMPVLSQNDPRWRNGVMLPYGDSIGGDGCALTSTAMILNYFGARLTPDQLSQCLGTGAEPLVWARAAACADGRVRGGDLGEFKWQRLDSILAGGRPAIVGMYGGQVGSHFVVVTSGGGDVADRYHIVDPWNGSSTETLGSYTRANWKLGLIVDYQGTSSNCGRLLVGSPVVGGFDDGSTYNHPITVKRLVGGADVEVRRMSYDVGVPDTVWKLASTLGLADDGSYRVIVSGATRRETKILTFTIDRTPPSVAAFFPGREQSRPPATATAVPVLAWPGEYGVRAKDALSGIQRVDAWLDGLTEANHSVIGKGDDLSRLRQVRTPGPHHLHYSATDVAGNSAQGDAEFIVQPPLPTDNHHEGQNGPGSSGPPPPGRPAGPVATPGVKATATSPTPAGTVAATTTCVAVVSPTLALVAGVVSWSATGTCSPYSGRIVGSYYSAGFVDCSFKPCLRAQPRRVSSAHAINALSGSFPDPLAGNYESATYTLTLRDGANHTITTTVTY